MSDKIVMSLYPSLIDSLMWLRIMKNREDKFQELINKINRIKSDEIPVAALKGIQFEDCVNTILKGGKLTIIEDVYSTNDFVFTKSLVDKIAARLVNHTKQQEYIQAIIPTSIGNVKVYGFTDYTYPDKIVDLKTTGSYKIDKFKDNAQHGCYSLIKKINGKPIKEFIYLVSDFNQVFVEKYDVNSAMQDEFNEKVVDFYEFITEHKDLITDKKIWGL